MLALRTSRDWYMASVGSGFGIVRNIEDDNLGDEDVEVESSRTGE
jgi:hypothetical protein